MNRLLENNTDVTGHIYRITNIQTNKIYIGQTLSHRKNRGKYRPFGYMGRFYDHISEALCNTKKKQCTYLNNAIRMYGKDAFHCDLLLECNKEDLDENERKYIETSQSLYPNGYNLTHGGKVFKNIDTPIEKINPIQSLRGRGGSTSRTKETRDKMSRRLKEVMGTPEARQEQMLRTQKQHSNMKLSKFNGVEIDMEHIERYIRIRNKKDGSQFIKIVIGKITTQFNGKYESIETLKNKAFEFIKSIQSSATLPNCSGNP